MKLAPLVPNPPLAVLEIEEFIVSANVPVAKLKVFANAAVGKARAKSVSIITRLILYLLE
jgi:hypothetical protein